MTSLETLAGGDPNPGALIDAIWDHILRDVEGFGLAVARATGFTWHRSEYTIPLDQLSHLMRLALSQPGADRNEKGDAVDIWFTRAPALVDESGTHFYRW